MKKILMAVALMLAVGSVVAGEEQGYLGVSITSVQNVDKGKDQNGIFIGGVYTGSGAEAAGIREDDRIAAVDGAAVRTLDDLESALDGTRPGDKVNVQVVREGQPKDIFVILGRAPEEVELHEVAEDALDDVTFGISVGGATELAFGDSKYLLELHEGHPRLGVEMQTLGPQLANHFEVDHGVLITEVPDTGAAGDAGLRAGDVILEINGEAVRDTDEIRHALRDHEVGDLVDVTVRGRGGIDVLAVAVEPAAVQFGSLELQLAPVGEASGSATIDLDRAGGARMSFTNASLILVKRDRAQVEKEIRALEKQLDRLREELDRIDDE